MDTQRRQFGRFFLVGLSIILLLGMYSSSTLAQGDSGWSLPELTTITTENAADLIELAQWGLGNLDNAAWSADGKMLAATSTAGTWLYDVGNLEAAPRLIPRDEQSLGEVLFNPVDNVLFTAACREPIKLWDASNLHQIAALGSTSFGCPKLFDFSPDGTLIAIKYPSDTIGLWRTDGTDQTIPVVILDGDMSLIQDVAFISDGSILATGTSDLIQLWDAATGAELTQLVGFDGMVYDLAFMPGRMILAGLADKSVLVWDVSDLENAQEIAALAMPSNANLYHLDFNADGSLLAASSNSSVQLWEFSVEDGTVDYLPSLRLEGHGDFINTLGFSPLHDILVTTSEDQTIRLWNARSGESIAMLTGFMVSPEIAYSPDGSLLAIAANYQGEDESVLLLDAATGEVARVLDSEFNQIGSLAFSPDGAHIAAGQSQEGRGGVKLWEVATGELQAHITGVIRAGSISFSPDGQWLAVAPWFDEDIIYMIDLETNEIVRTLGEDVYTDNVMSIAFSPDSQTLLAGGLDGTAHMWDVSSGRVTVNLNGIETSVLSVHYDPDNLLPVTGTSSGTVYVWNPIAGILRTTLDTNVSRVRVLAYHPEEVLLAVGGTDIELWDLRALTPLMLLEEPIGQIRSMAFHPNGQVLATAGEEGIVRLWGVPAE